MSKSKKKEYWLVCERAQEYRIEVYRDGERESSLWICGHEWCGAVALAGSPLRLRAGYKIKISITPTKTGFSVRAIGKPEKMIGLQ